MTDWATLNGQRIVSGYVTIPYYGAWSADVILALVNTIPTTVSLGLGNLTLAGAVFRQLSYAGSRSARIVGGFGGWRTPLPSKSYQNPSGIPLALVLGDAAAESGEQVSVPAPQNVTIGTAYVREAAPASRVLRQLAGSLWWIDPSGVTQLQARPVAPTPAPPTWPAITSDFQVISYAGGKGKFEVATEAIADWLPGRTFTSPVVTTTQTIASVTHTIDNDGKLRLTVMTTP